MALRPRSLIFDFYGSFARHLGGWVAIADLIVLMGESDVSEAAVRSSVSRMSQRELLVRSKRDSVVGYAMTEQTHAILREGDRRLFTNREPADLSHGWAIAVFSVPETERQKRHMLRSRLQRLGFGSVGAGLCIAPSRLLGEARDMLVRLHLESYVEMFEARYAGFDDLTRMIPRWWDLESLRAGYTNFLNTSGPVLARWEGDGGSVSEAFVDFLHTISEWRRLAYLDPGLPPEVLPRDWEGSSATARFFAIAGHVEARALAFVARMTGLGGS